MGILPEHGIGGTPTFGSLLALMENNRLMNGFGTFGSVYRNLNFDKWVVINDHA
jgi:hypothetical protein